MKLEPISLKRSPTHTERWVQDRIAEDPTILGLGDLILKDKERPQANAGRLDLLLQDPETLKRYEVEMQLGSTDESHIIRTIEYWDIERKRYPQYEHAAVIVAEEITARFLNVIQLFNGAIPLIALKMTAYKIGEDHALTFVKVLDEMRYGLVDEDEPVAEPVDRAYWEARSSKKMLSFTDALLKLVQEIEPDATLRYNKYYVGIGVGGQAFNFVTFSPRRAHVIMTVKLPRSDEVDQQLEDAELDTLAYDSQWRQYRLRLSEMVTGPQRDVLLALVRESRESFGRAR
jgi:hypothetical protein